jgi:hypothetical protein
MHLRSTAAAKTQIPADGDFVGMLHAARAIQLGKWVIRTGSFRFCGPINACPFFAYQETTKPRQLGLTLSLTAGYEQDKFDQKSRP